MLCLSMKTDLIKISVAKIRVMIGVLLVTLGVIPGVIHGAILVVK